MSDKSKIGLIGTGRIGEVAALRSAAKDGSIDVDPNA